MLNARSQSRRETAHLPPCNGAEGRRLVEDAERQECLTQTSPHAPAGSPLKRSTRLADRDRVLQADSISANFPARSSHLGAKSSPFRSVNGATEKVDCVPRELDSQQRRDVASTLEATAVLQSMPSPPTTTAQATPSASTSGDAADTDNGVSCRVCPTDAQGALPVSERKWSSTIKTKETGKSSPAARGGRMFLVGDILWARLAGHPWWPAMVVYDPTSGIFMDASRRKWHVQFFGFDPQRAWVTSGGVVAFESPDQFPALPSKSPNTVAQRHLSSWSYAVQDATRALDMNKQQRRQCFTFKYELAKPIEKSTAKQEGSRKRPRLDEANGTDSPLISVASSPKRRKSSQSLDSLLVNDSAKCSSRMTSKTSEMFSLETPPTSETASVDMDTSMALTPVSSPVARKPAPRRLRGEVLCSICEQEYGSEKVTACMACGDVYHLDCLGVTQVPDGFHCDECTVGVKTCLVCKGSDGTLRSCASTGCKKSFHMECVAEFPSKRQGHQGVSCPLHSCETCAYLGSSRRGKLVRCARCPVVFHASDSCLPAGYQRGIGQTIICPRHARQKKMHPNMSWCFDCGGGGKLVCCDRCPAAFHQHCLPSNDPECQMPSMGEEADDLACPGPGAMELPCSSSDGASSALAKPAKKQSSQWLCPDCRNGRWLHHGDLIWCKLGTYR